MDRASMFLRQQFPLTPADVGPSIQSPRWEEVLARIPTTSRNKEIPLSEDALGDKGAALEMEVATIGGMKIDID